MEASTVPHRRDPVGVAVLAASGTEIASAARRWAGLASEGGRDAAVTRVAMATSLLAAAGRSSWRAPMLTAASLYHFLLAGRGGGGPRRGHLDADRLLNVLWAAALGGLLCEARRAERWEG